MKPTSILDLTFPNPAGSGRGFMAMEDRLGVGSLYGLAKARQKAGIDAHPGREVIGFTLHPYRGGTLMGCWVDEEGGRFEFRHGSKADLEQIIQGGEPPTRAPGDLENLDLRENLVSLERDVGTIIIAMPFDDTQDPDGTRRNALLRRMFNSTQGRKLFANPDAQVVLAPPAPKTQGPAHEVTPDPLPRLADIKARAERDEPPSPARTPSHPVVAQPRNRGPLPAPAPSG